MASKIKSHTFYVAIDPYKAGANEETFNELSVMTAYDDHRKHFYISLHAGWKSSYGGHGCIFLGPDDPLTAPKYVKVKDSPKNSQKTINEMGANLELAKDAIAWLFNKRDWQRLYLAVRNIALNGYIDPYRQQMEKLMQPEPKGEPIVKQVDVMGLMNALSTTGRAKLSDFAKPIDEEPKEEPKTVVSEPLKKWNDLKQKHPDALLLFRCGDFYEVYQEEAEQVARICGITLMKCKGLGDTEFYRMAGFPNHALDTYLPKIIRAGKRVAICDGITINDNELNESKQEDKDMRLNLNANQSENQNVAMQPQVNNNAAPAIEDAVAEEIKDVEVQEVQDIVPVATPKPAETPAETKAEDSTPAVTVPLSDHGTLVVGGVPKRDKNGKFMPKAKAEPKPDPEAVGELAGMLTRVNLVVYKTKKGADAPMIVGFSGEDDERWKKLHEAKPKWVSAGYRKNDEGTKQYHLMFGSRYMAVAKALCEAYNTTDKAEWDKAEQACAGCYDGIVSGFKAEREAKKQERAASREAAGPAPEKTYTNEDVAAMLRKVLAGGSVPEDIAELLKAA